MVRMFRRQIHTAPFERAAAESDAATRARLVVMAGARAGMRYAVDKELVIGRGETVDVLLEDGEISRHHARIFADDRGVYWVEDLGSRNGTFLNGLQLQKGELRFGDRLTLGQHTLLLARVDSAEDYLRKRERLATLGRISAGVAHDLNNMLGAIVATVDYLGKVSLENEVEVRECLRDIHQAVRRAASLTPKLVSFARSESTGHGTVDLTALAGEVAELCRRAFDRAVEVETDIEPAVELTGDGVELYQALMNLCLNARDAMPSGGLLAIGVHRIREGAAAALGLPRAPHIHLSVADSGSGIDDATKARLFDPFFTTKGRFGTGLGLATVAETVEIHGGIIRVESEVGHGSRFDVYLPATRPWSARTKETAPRVSRPRLDKRPPSERTILLADDEPTVRRSIARLLRGEGYRVIEAYDGAEAVQLYRQHKPRPDLCIVDVNMPNVDGIEALKILRQLDRACRVVMISGHIDGAQASQIEARGAVRVLAKPCSAAELLTSVAEALGPGDVPDPDATGERRALDPSEL